MGGGAGLSVNGRYRVATERAVFAMPEARIGFAPDCGASRFLNRCPGHLGLYLGLTGRRCGAADMLHLGLATHFTPSAPCNSGGENQPTLMSQPREAPSGTYSCG